VVRKNSTRPLFDVKARCDIDWEGMRMGIRQSYVYGKAGAVKTPASQRWMPLDRSLAEKLRQHQLRYISPMNKEGWIFATQIQKSPSGQAEFRRTGLSPLRKKWDWAGSAGIHFDTAIPLCCTHSVWISRFNRNYYGMRIFAQR